MCVCVCVRERERERERERKRERERERERGGVSNFCTRSPPGKQMHDLGFHTGWAVSDSLTRESDC